MHRVIDVHALSKGEVFVYFIGSNQECLDYISGCQDSYLMLIL